MNFMRSVSLIVRKPLSSVIVQFLLKLLKHTNAMYTLQVRPFMVSSVRSSGEIPKNVAENLTTAQHQQGNGVIYDKKPFKIELVEGMIE